MSASSCPLLEGCSAPLCPLDEASLEHGNWFPSEESCHRRDLSKTPWVVRQRRIDKATGGEFARGCFTVAMLATDCRITKAFRGLDPEAGEITPEKVRGWIEKHPAITEADRARLRAQGRKKVAIHGGFVGRERQNGSAPEGAAPEVVKSCGRAQV